MDETEFDRFAEEYRSLHAANIGASGETPEFFAAYKVRDVAERLRREGIHASAILDFGSGVGNSIPHFRRWLPDAALYCADVSRKSLAVAEGRFPGAARQHLIENNSLASLEQRFDVLFSACVFHHLPHDEHVHWLAELRSVASPGALLAVFEHNPWNPLTAHAVDTCPFDENAHLLPAPRLRQAVAAAGWRDGEVRYRIFFPGALARLRPLERMLFRLPLGAQYSVFARA
jgi:SAM-dependent methyltransferase